MEILKKDIDIYYRLWDDVREKRAFIQIFHGMVEHIGRYEDFAKFLNEHGIVVYGMDVRGHGLTGKNSNLGYFAKEDGWNRVLEDQKDLFEAMKIENPDKPFFLLGHSMGSFFARNYINKYPSDFDACIVMATGKADEPSYAFARFILKFLNPLKPAKFMDSMAFSSYNRAVKNPKTQYDWLSKDEESVKKYLEDPYCGFMVKNSFYRDFMEGMKFISKLEKNPTYKRPVLFLAGQEDPVGKMGEFVKEAAGHYPNKKLILYPGMRHEILNEIDNQKVYQDILSWINSKI